MINDLEATHLPMESTQRLYVPAHKPGEGVSDSVVKALLLPKLANYVRPK